MSVIEQNKEIDGQTLLKYLPNVNQSLPVLYQDNAEGLSEREILYKVLFDMKKDVTDLKQVVFQLLDSEGNGKSDINDQLYQRLYGGEEEEDFEPQMDPHYQIEQHAAKYAGESAGRSKKYEDVKEEYHEVVDEDESLSISESEKKLIRKALLKHNGKRKYAAEDLGISERTLYRKIKEYEIEE
jgi:DNA-binding NtrC family response regulator